MSVYFNYLTEAFCFALNPPLYFLSPVNRVVTRVWSQISGGGNTRGWISLFSVWLRELLRCKGKDLRGHQNQNSLVITLQMYLAKAHSCNQKWRICCFHLQDIEPLAKTVVQGVKLCGQILSHLSRKAKRKLK